MCGISGLWNIACEEIPQNLFDPFNDALAHRGPDGRGIHHDSQARLWLGHRRLSILDLSDSGAQPMSYLGERYWLTFNGEIYNFLELRKGLESEGFRFTTSSDSEVILASFHRWGEKCQFKFNGMWAFAIWDRELKQLFLSRDRFGVKPLYYLYDGKRFAFASEMKGFLRLPFFDLAFDEAIVARTLADSNSIESTESSLLKGLKRLKSGHSLTVSEKGGLHLERWWNTLDHLEKPPESWEERVEKFRSLLQSACQLRMRSDLPLGSAVSGGLDSSSVLSLLGAIRRKGNIQERIHPQMHKAFAALYPGTSQDEQIYAEEIIRFTETPAAYCPIDPSKLVEYVDQVLFSMEEIFDATLGPWLLYREYRKHGIVISIDGHGADELLGGYHHHVEVACSGALLPFFRPHRFAELRGLQKEIFPPGSPHGVKSVSRLLRERIQNRLKMHPKFYGMLKRVFSQNQMKSWLKVGWDNQSPDWESAHFDILNGQLYDDFHRRTLPTILRNFDRSSMAHGIEVRSPFLDWRLVSYSFSLPAEDKIGDGQTKRILREAMKGRLPEMIRARKSKVGFASPMVEWMKGPLQSLVRDCLNSDSFLHSTIWDGPQIRDHVENCYKNHDFMGVRSCWEFIAANQVMELFRKRRYDSASL